MCPIPASAIATNKAIAAHRRTRIKGYRLNIFGHEVKDTGSWASADHSLALPNTRAEAEPATVGCNPTTNLRRQLKPLIRNALRSLGLGFKKPAAVANMEVVPAYGHPLRESVPPRQRNLHASSNGLLRKSDLSVRAQMNHLAQMRLEFARNHELILSFACIRRLVGGIRIR